MTIKTRYNDNYYDSFFKQSIEKFALIYYKQYVGNRYIKTTLQINLVVV
jgi:hypothetical protein